MSKEEQMEEERFHLQVTGEQYRILTHIAKINGFVHPKGTVHAGKMNTQETIGYLLQNYQDKIA
jgi:hypothetical protein